jgi:uncharacterized membrane protein
MRKTTLILLGALLIVFGAISLAKGGIPHTVHHTFDIAVVKGSVNTDEVWEVHPVFAGLSIAAGAALLFAGARDGK